MKENLRNHNETKDAFTRRENWIIHLSSTESPPAEKIIRVRRRCHDLGTFHMTRGFTTIQIYINEDVPWVEEIPHQLKTVVSPVVYG